MNSIKVALTALIAGASISVSMPVMAQSGSDGTVQTNTQDIGVFGNDNRVRTGNRQNATCVRNGSGTSGDCATVQDSFQRGTVEGDRNSVNTKNEQNSTNVRNTGNVRIRR